MLPELAFDRIVPSIDMTTVDERINVVSFGSPVHPRFSTLMVACDPTLTPSFKSRDTLRMPTSVGHFA